ncbi:MAG: hypothetical protein HYU44_08200, partial [Betaproteobacteria bacterium]|nr:hypothetical protein [Betaproteobacteria bacterium]
EVPLDEAWQLRADRALGAIEAEDPGVIFFPSPNNPTGNRLDPEVMRAVIESTPGKATVAVPYRGGKPVPYPFVPPGINAP